MQQLGYETYHMTSILQNPKDAYMWHDALRAKYENGKPFGRREWDQLLGHVEAVTDFPAAVFVEELVQAYPDAKVVLTLRDVDAWYGSMQQTIMKQTYSTLATVMGWIDPELFGEGNQMCRTGFDGLFDGDFEKNGKRAFEEHYNLVRRVVPADNLLEWKPQDGWEPLCKFLGRPVPATPFPKANDKEIFQKKSSAVVRSTFARVARKIALYSAGCATIGAAATYGFRAWARYQALRS